MTARRQFKRDSQRSHTLWEKSWAPHSHQWQWLGCTDVPSKKLWARGRRSKTSRRPTATIPGSRGHQQRGAKRQRHEGQRPQLLLRLSESKASLLVGLEREPPVYWPACFLHLVSNSNHLTAEMYAPRIRISSTKRWLQHSRVLRTEACAATKHFFTIFLPNLEQSCFPGSADQEEGRSWKPSL